MTIRNRQVSGLILQQLSALIQKEVSDPRIRNITLTSLDLSPDRRNAKVFYTFLDKSQAKEIKAALTKASGFFRQLLAHNTSLRYVPKLHFVYDELIERAERITHLIGEVAPLDENHENDENDENKIDDEI